MSSFQDLDEIVHNNPEAEAQRSFAQSRRRRITRQREPVLRL